MGATQQPALPAVGSDIFGQYDKGIALASSVILLLAVSAIDKLTGFELRLQVLYMIPVAVATWSAGRVAGFALSAASALTWVAMFLASHNYSSNLYHYWDGALWLVSLVVFVALLARLREELEWSSQGLVAVLAELDAAVYVVDAERRELLYANPRLQERFGADAVDSLNARAARECRVRWPDGRRAILRILP
jgi:PAS domain-containing protein